MKHLKNFKVFEAVIVPHEINTPPRFNSYQEVVQFGQENGFDVVDYDEFYNSLTDADKRNAPPRPPQMPMGPPPGMRMGPPGRMMGPPPGMRRRNEAFYGGEDRDQGRFQAPNPPTPFFALYHPERERPMFVLCDQNFWRIPIFGEILKDVISHEFVHAEQKRRMGDIEYALPSPTQKELYFSDKNEVMAFSWTIANEIKKNSRDLEGATEFLKNLDRKSRSLGPVAGLVTDIYRHCDEKTIKRYHKYIYMYLQEFYHEE